MFFYDKYKLGLSCAKLRLSFAKLIKSEGQLTWRLQVTYDLMTWRIEDSEGTIANILEATIDWDWDWAG